MTEELTRDEFRKAVFERDNHDCVVCGRGAVDAHHLYERKLWRADNPGDPSFGGYYLDNGVSLCAGCHKDAESTEWSPRELADLAGIRSIPLPKTLESGYEYDKWGNVMLSNGTRMIGPLFYDRNVQRALERKLHDGTFTKYVKYPRTPHLPWSKGTTPDDMVWAAAEHYWGRTQSMVITEKMDGENTTIYSDYIHARSIDSGYHESRTWVKNFAAQWQHELQGSMRVSGENLYAKHSIKYTDLPSYFLGFSVWRERFCLSWDETLEWFEILGITPVKTLFTGFCGDALINWCKNEGADLITAGEIEGYVIRPTDGFYFDEFRQKVAKCVRPNHVTTETHWKHKQLDKNLLMGYSE